MKIRYRLLMTIGITLACMVSGMYLMSSRVMLASFLDLERQGADRDVERVQQALGQMVAELHVKSVDWANWDDTYLFMRDRNKAYIESNLSDDSVKQLQLDMMMFVGDDQRVFFAKPVTRTKGTVAPVADKVLGALLQADCLQGTGSDENGVSGFLLQDTGLMMVSVRPIHTSDGKGVRHGWMVFCRYVNDQLVKRLEEITRLDLKPYLIQGQGLSPDCKIALSHLSAKSPRYVATVSESTIAGYSVVKDLSGKSTLLIKMTKPRQIYQQGLSTVALVTRMMVIAALVFSFVSWIVLERFALSRLSRLSSLVGSIGEETTGVRVSLPGRDELTSLASKINEMLAKLEKRTVEIAAKNSVLENAVEGIAELDSEGRFKTANTAFARVFDCTPEEMVGNHWTDRIGASEHETLKGCLKIASESGRSLSEFIVTRLNGSVSHHEVTIIRSEGGHGSPGGSHWFMKDISERKQLESDIEHQAFHDRLTGLPNRALFLNRIEKALARAARSKLGVATLFIDLDNFKFINDSLGHHAGDRMLQIVADRLQAAVREVDTVSRLGGDEFTILLEDLTNVDEAVEVCTRVLKGLEPVMRLFDTEAFARGSIGIAFASDPDMTAETLMKNADRAMYIAKANGKAGYVLYDKSMDDEALVRIDLETSLGSAIDHTEIFLEYQPIIDLANGSFLGAEALARWKHPTRGFVPPTKFICIAEESGLIIPIGYWIMEEACRQMKAWQDDHGVHDLSVSVNVSGKQLQRPDVVSRVKTVLKKTGLAPECLKLEITESILISNRADVTDKLLQLKKLGVKLALDDFGTGFSSLSTLSSFPVDTLKIDRSFVNRLEEGGETRAIVEAILAMSRSMKIDVTGEGIETGFQMLTLKELGCKAGQGFLFDAPLPADEFGDRLAHGGTTEALEIKRRRLLEIQEMFQGYSGSKDDDAA